MSDAREKLDGVITAGARLDPADAARFGTDVKALVSVGGQTLLAKAIEALRGSPEIARITVVGPRAARTAEPQPDNWIDEFESGEENLLAALGAARTRRVVFCASDLPCIGARAISTFLGMVRGGLCAAYPIYDRATFLAAYPGGRTRFLKLSDGEWTGASVMVLDPSVFRQRAALVKQLFGSRKEPLTLTKLLGLALTMRYMAGKLRVTDLESHASRLLGKPVGVIRGADPSLAMDCDDASDFDYALSLIAGEQRRTVPAEE